MPTTNIHNGLQHCREWISTTDLKIFQACIHADEGLKPLSVFVDVAFMTTQNWEGPTRERCPLLGISWCQKHRTVDAAQALPQKTGTHHG